MESSLSFFLCLCVPVFCLSALLTPEERLRKTAREMIEMATLYLSMPMITTVLLTIGPIYKGKAFDVAECMRWFSAFSHPLAGAAKLAGVTEIPVEAVLYNPFYWIFVGFIWVFLIGGALFLVAGICDWAIWGGKMFFRGRSNASLQE